MRDAITKELDNETQKAIREIVSRALSFLGDGDTACIATEVTYERCTMRNNEFIPGHVYVEVDAIMPYSEDIEAELALVRQVITEIFCCHLTITWHVQQHVATFSAVERNWNDTSERT